MNRIQHIRSFAVAAILRGRKEFGRQVNCIKKLLWNVDTNIQGAKNKELGQHDMKYGQNESTRDDEKACGTTRFSQYCSTPGMFKLREQGTGGNDKGLNDDVLRI